MHVILTHTHTHEDTYVQGAMKRTLAGGDGERDICYLHAQDNELSTLVRGGGGRGSEKGHLLVGGEKFGFAHNRTRMLWFSLI